MRFRAFTAWLLTCLVFVSSVGVNAYAGYCSCLKQNFVSFLYKNECCEHTKAAQCCLKKAEICKKESSQELKKSKCCDAQSFYFKVSTATDKLPELGWSGQIKAKFEPLDWVFPVFYSVQTFQNRVKFQIWEQNQRFNGWLPPPLPAGRDWLHFAQVYRC